MFVIKVESPADDQAGAIEEEQDSKRLRIDTSNDYRPHEQTEIPDDSELARLNHDLSQLQQENEHWSGLLRRFQSSQSESSQTSVLSHALSNNGGSFG